MSGKLEEWAARFKDRTRGSCMPLAVRVSYDRVCIEVGIHTLAFVAENSDKFSDYDEESGEYVPRYRVEDVRQFAKDVVLALNNEREDGTTPVHLLLDAAIEAAADDGSLGLAE